MKLSHLVTLLALGALPATVSFAEDEIYGTAMLGYTTAQTTGFPSLQGNLLQGEISWNAMKLASGPRLLVGGEILWNHVKGSDNGVDLEVKALAFGPNVGFRFGLADKIDFVYLYSFDFALLGDTVVNGKEKEVKSYFRHNNSMRAMFPLYSDIDLGFGATLSQTSVKRPDADNPIVVSGLSFQAVFTQKIM